MIEIDSGGVYFIPFSSEKTFNHFPQNVYTVVFDSDNSTIVGAHNGEVFIGAFLRKANSIGLEGILTVERPVIQGQCTKIHWGGHL